MCKGEKQGSFSRFKRYNLEKKEDVFSYERMDKTRIDFATPIEGEWNGDFCRKHGAKTDAGDW